MLAQAGNNQDDGFARSTGQLREGLWRVVYTAGGSTFNKTLDQWHSDGTEFENAWLPPIQAISVSASGRKSRQERGCSITSDGSSLQAALPLQPVAPSRWTRRTPCLVTAKPTPVLSPSRRSIARGPQRASRRRVRSPQHESPSIEKGTNSQSLSWGSGTGLQVLHSNQGDLTGVKDHVRDRALDDCLICEALS